MDYFEPTRSELRSFDGRLTRFGTIDGPVTLVRFHDTGRGRAGAYGAFWMYGSEVKELLADRTLGDPYFAIKEVSKRWAVCDDWGDLGLCTVMRVPGQARIGGWFGFAKAQPKISWDTQCKTGRITTNYYEGGSMQLVLRIGHTEKLWMTGPYLTKQLHPKHIGP